VSLVLGSSRGDRTRKRQTEVACDSGHSSIGVYALSGWTKNIVACRAKAYVTVNGVRLTKYQTYRSCDADLPWNDDGNCIESPRIDPA
jgi:hypothetical protein